MPFIMIKILAFAALIIKQSFGVTEELSETKGKGLLNFLLNPCSCECGIPNREGRLMIGEFLKTYEFPWLASVQIREEKGVLATLISNRYVVTSAASLTGLTPYDVKVTLGQFGRCFSDISSTNISVERIISHPDFNSAIGVNDIALVKLKSPVSFERRVSPICLSTPGNKYVGQVATMVGWNKVGNDSEKSGCRPRKLGLPVLELAHCFGTAVRQLSTDKGCVGVVGSPNPICKVDAGGPVMYRSREGVYHLIGILSDVNDCEGTPSAAVYITINDHLPWIIKNTQDSCYCTTN